MSLYKKILAKLEDFGFYQIRIFILVSLLEISTAISMVLPVLTHAKVNFRCSFFINSQNTTDSNSSSDLLNLTKQDDLLLTFTTEQTMSHFVITVVTRNVRRLPSLRNLLLSSVSGTLYVTRTL